LPDRYPAQAHDTEAIVAWVHANIRRFGGAPGRIYIGGIRRARSCRRSRR
jgi:acetyl esterase/lipase